MKRVVITVKAHYTVDAHGTCRADSLHVSNDVVSTSVRYIRRHQVSLVRTTHVDVSDV
jgi:hypothetical protein